MCQKGKQLKIVMKKKIPNIAVLIGSQSGPWKKFKKRTFQSWVCLALNAISLCPTLPP